MRHLDAAFARIWTLKDQENLLELQASAGEYTRLNGEYARMLVGELHIGGIAQERKPYVANDLGVRPTHRAPRVGGTGADRLYGRLSPVVEGRLVGVLAMFARQALGRTLSRRSRWWPIPSLRARSVSKLRSIAAGDGQLHVLSRRLFQIQENGRRHLAGEFTTSWAKR